MVKKSSCVTSFCGNRCKALSIQNMCLVNIILLVAEIIPDNWHCFSFWHQVSVFCDFLLFVPHFSYHFTSDSLHVQGCGLLQHNELELTWLVDRCALQSLHAQCVKLDEFICLPHRRLCDVTIAHTYIAMVILERYHAPLVPRLSAAFWLVLLL